MKKLLRGLIFAMMAATLVMAGCSGDDGKNGAPGQSAYDIAVDNGYTGTYDEYAALVTPGTGAQVEPESCGACHATVGDQHQAIYNAYSDKSNVVMTITGYTVTPVTNSATLSDAEVTFTVTQNGYEVPDLSNFAQKRLYTVGYNAATGKFDNSVGFSIGNVATAGVFTATATYNSAKMVDGFPVTEVYGYVADEQLPGTGNGPFPALYDNVSNTGELDAAAAPYVSAANVSGCEKCHGAPYMKHGYRAAGDVGTLGDFAACKACHYDSRNGGHQLWQMMADVPERAAEIELGNSSITPEERIKYAYTANVMNDTHMSHAMEFPYPQTIANCNACHEGKLDMVLDNSNFTLTTCKSCHPVNGNPDYPSMAPPLAGRPDLDYPGVVPHGFTDATVCIDCHNAGAQGIAPVFAEIHKGYNPVVNYTETDKYSDAITVTIDSAVYNSTTMNMAIEATVKVSKGGFAANEVEPSAAFWGLYAYDSDDLLTSRNGATTGEGYVTEVDASTVKWSLNADFSAYADEIAAGDANRAQVEIQPAYYNADGDMVALNAPTEIVNLSNGTFDAPVDFVDTDKCNVCHDALGITFHSPDRGGNIEACKTCHVATSGGSHLEMQSRDIDSYVHAIHSFQPFDYGDIDFNDPVQDAHYILETEDFFFPTFTTLSCEACHNSGTYNVPNQQVSLAALQSPSETNDTTTRAISGIPSVVTGPASNACGGCHRAMLINEDDAGGLTSFNQHTKQFGYRVDNEPGVQATIWETIQSIVQ